MKGDIGFVGFMLTADEWQALDADSRAALIAVATRRMEALTPPPSVQLRTDPVAPLPAPPRRMPEGTGKHEILDMIDPDLAELDEADLDELLEPDPDMEAAIREDEANHVEIGRNADVVSESVEAGTGDFEDFSDWAEL